MDALEPITYPYGSYFINLLAPQLIVSPLGLAIEHAFVQKDKLAAILDADVVLRPDVIDHPAFSGWSQNFFFSTFCKICLSRLRSTTSLFNCELSFSRLFNLRSLEIPSPLYFFFQLKKNDLPDSYLTAHLLDMGARLYLFNRKSYMRCRIL